MAAFLRALGATADDIPAGREERLARYRDLLRRRAALVVLDNIGSSKDAEALLPTAPGSLALVTSRQRLTTLTARHGVVPIVLGPIGESASITLLNRLVGARDDWEPEVATGVARACAGHPLALCLAGARIATRPEEPLAEVVAALAEPGRRMAALNEFAEPSEAVDDIIGWSYRALAEPSARVFRLLGMSPCPTLDVPVPSRPNRDYQVGRHQIGQDAGCVLIAKFSQPRHRMVSSDRAAACTPIRSSMPTTITSGAQLWTGCTHTIAPSRGRRPTPCGPSRSRPGWTSSTLDAALVPRPPWSRNRSGAGRASRPARSDDRVDVKVTSRARCRQVPPPQPGDPHGRCGKGGRREEFPACWVTIACPTCNPRARWTLDQINQWIKFADAKASVLLAAGGFVGWRHAEPAGDRRS